MFSQFFDKNLKKVAKSLKRMDIDFDVVQRNDGTPFIAVPYDVRIGNRTEPVDVTIDSQTDKVFGDDYLSVTAFVTKGQTGKNEPTYNRVLDHLNYESVGKFVPDVNDGSRDILYSENMPKNPRPTVLKKTVQRVAGTVTRVRPDLKQLSIDLNLQPKLESGEEDKFAAQWHNTRKNIHTLQSPDPISFLQPGKKYTNR